jgi:hypothetical protein
MLDSVKKSVFQSLLSDDDVDAVDCLWKIIKNFKAREKQINALMQSDDLKR